MKIKIITLMALNAVGGAVTHIETLEWGLRRKNHNLEVISSTQISKMRRTAILLEVFLDRDAYRKKLAVLQIKSLKAAMRNTTSDVVHAHDALACLAVEDEQFLVWTVHGPIFEEAVMQGTATSENKFGLFLLEAEKRAAERANKIICVDNGQRSLLVKKYPKINDKIVVIPNSAHFDFDCVETGTDKYIFCSRRLVEKNGIGIAIEAFGLLEENEYQLWIAGDGPLKEKYIKLIEENKLNTKVKLLGEIRNRRELGMLTYNSTAILVPSVPFSGVIEATSISALEGMILSKPVIASDIGGLSEIIEDGITGLLVPPGDPVALSKAIERILKNATLRSTLGQNAYNAATNRYGVETWIENIEKTYTSFRYGNENSSL